MHRLDIPGDEEDGDHDKDEAQRPGGEADGEDGGAHRKFIGDDASDERGGGGADGFDEILDGIGSGAYFRQGDVVDGGDDVRRCERHENGGEHEGDAEKNHLRVGDIHGDGKEYGTQQDAGGAGDETSAFGAFEELIPEYAAQWIPGSHEEHRWGHDQ